jgi:hypothetical protein
MPMPYSWNPSAANFLNTWNIFKVSPRGREIIEPSTTGTLWNQGQTFGTGSTCTSYCKGEHGNNENKNSLQELSNCRLCLCVQLRYNCRARLFEVCVDCPPCKRLDSELSIPVREENIISAYERKLFAGTVFGLQKRF